MAWGVELGRGRGVSGSATSVLTAAGQAEQAPWPEAARENAPAATRAAALAPAVSSPGAGTGASLFRRSLRADAEPVPRIELVGVELGRARGVSGSATPALTVAGPDVDAVAPAAGSARTSPSIKFSISRRQYAAPIFFGGAEAETGRGAGVDSQDGRPKAK